MPLLARTVNTPLAIEVRRGAIADLGAILSDQRISAGGDVAVVVGPGQGERIAELIRPGLRQADLFPVTGGSLAAAAVVAAVLYVVGDRSGWFDGDGGTTTRGMPSSRAMATAWSGPPPPYATSA